MQQHRRIQSLTQLRGNGDVVIVSVGAHHRDHIAPADRIDDRLRGVGGIEDHHIIALADNPNVVIDFPTAAVEFESSAGDHPLNSTHPLTIDPGVPTAALRAKSGACSGRTPIPMKYAGSTVSHRKREMIGTNQPGPRNFFSVSTGSTR